MDMGFYHTEDCRQPRKDCLRRGNQSECSQAPEARSSICGNRIEQSRLLPKILLQISHTTRTHMNQVSSIPTTAEGFAPIVPPRKDPTAMVADIAVIGLGYVGLPLSLQFARSGVNVLGTRH
jgi:hypothetical protein